MVSRVSLSFATAAIALTLATTSAAAEGEVLRLNTAITVQAPVVTLGDVFAGDLVHPEKVVTRAPKPGQRMDLSAEWLAATARANGLDWRPASTLDSAVVVQPGQNITKADVLAAVKTALVEGGMPESFQVTMTTAITPITIAMNVSKDVAISNVQFDTATKKFSAVAQIAQNEAQAATLQVHGVAYPTVQVPVLKDAVGKSAKITAEMIDFIEMRQDNVKPATVMDPEQLIGKTPRMFLRGGQPIHDNQVSLITIVQVPVLTNAMDRDGRITDANVKLVDLDSALLPTDVVTDLDFLIGKNPRRPLAAGMPIRRADVAVMQQVEVPVATRDLPRGTVVTDADINWVMINAADAMSNVATSEEEIVGQATRYLVRAGQQVRTHSVIKEVAVKRGQSVTVMWSVQSINLTAMGSAKEPGSVGDLIRVTNTKSNQTVLAEVIDSRTVRVAAPDQVSTR